jgi:hypothetical protein
MSVYDIDFQKFTQQLLPPSKRKTRNLAWLGVYATEFQYLHDLIFSSYADGFTGIKWVAGAYTLGQQVRYADHSVYEVAVANTATTPGTSTDWIKVQNIWVGARERMKYNGTRLTLEYALNKWFDSVFRQPPAVSDIHITQNTIITQFEIANNAANSNSFIPRNSVFGSDGVPRVAVALNVYSFNINVPIAIANGLTTEAPNVAPAISANRENIIRSFADKYVVAGIKYKVITF